MQGRAHLCNWFCTFKVHGARHVVILEIGMLWGLVLEIHELSDWNRRGLLHGPYCVDRQAFAKQPSSENRMLFRLSQVSKKAPASAAGHCTKCDMCSTFKGFTGWLFRMLMWRYIWPEASTRRRSGSLWLLQTMLWSTGCKQRGMCIVCSVCGSYTLSSWPQAARGDCFNELGVVSPRGRIFAICGWRMHGGGQTVGFKWCMLHALVALAGCGVWWRQGRYDTVLCSLYRGVSLHGKIGQFSKRISVFYLQSAACFWTVVCLARIGFGVVWWDISFSSLCPVGPVWWRTL